MKSVPAARRLSAVLALLAPAAVLAVAVMVLVRRPLPGVRVGPATRPVLVPAGTRNHLALDLGLDRGDLVAALDGFGEAVERRIDLGQVGERIFVNNATVGLYAKIVQSPAYRGSKAATALELLPGDAWPGRRPL